MCVWGDCKFQLCENHHVPPHWPVPPPVSLPQVWRLAFLWVHPSSTAPKTTWWFQSTGRSTLHAGTALLGGGESLHAETHLFVSVELMQCQSPQLNSVLSHFSVKMWFSSSYPSFLPQTTNAFLTLSQWLLGWTPAHPSTWLRTNNTNQIATVKNCLM